MRPFPNVSDGQWQVSTGGGEQALWAKDGRELFYVASDGALMTVPVTAGDGAWRAGTPTVVVKGGYYIGGAGGLSRQYDVSPDSRRFLMIKLGGGGDEAAGAQNLIVVQNWLEALRAGVPAN